MKQNFRMVQINGFRGLLITLFIISCLIAGFIAFPAFLTMCAWNYLATTTSSFPSINFGGGLLLWAIIILSILTFNKKKFIVSFKAQNELTEDEVSEVLSRIKAQSVHHQILKPKDLNIKSLNHQENENEVKETQSEKKEN